MPPLSLPESSGVILLPDTALFPHGHLPLHIFEPRYREMLADALEGDCLFCVGSLLGPETGRLAECAAPIGTLALIRASHELPDGRSELVLQGICRVHFRRWSSRPVYPHAAIEPFHAIDLPADEAPSCAARLRHSISRTLEALPEKIAIAIDGILGDANDPLTIADIVAQQLVTDPAIRRRLLEEPEVAKRVEILVDLLDRATPWHGRD